MSYKINTNKYNLEYGNLLTVGIYHNYFSDSEVLEVLNKQSMNADAICIEAPAGYDKNCSEHKAAKIYKQNNNIDLFYIDKKSVEKEQYIEYHDSEKLSDKHMLYYTESFDDKAHEEHMEELVGRQESKKFGGAEYEFTEREQMMAIEILDYMKKGYNNIIAVMGCSHARKEGIDYQAKVLCKKYNY